MTGQGSCHICGAPLHGDSNWVQDKAGLWCAKCYRASKDIGQQDDQDDLDAHMLASLILQGRTLSDIESLLIESAVKLEKGNLSRAAKRLGIGRATIYRKMGPISEVRGEPS